MLISVIVYLVIIVDQLTKWWAVNKLKPIGEIELIQDALYFKYTTNDGMAFGLLSNQRWIFLLLTTLIIAGIIVFLVITREKAKHPLLISALGLILGGGVSNMIDRIFFGTELLCGRVVDFIDFRLINFAVFNIADSAVCVGEALFIIYFLFVDTKAGKKGFFAFNSDGNKLGKTGDIEKTSEKKADNAR